MENENKESLEEIHQRICESHGHYSRNEDSSENWKSQEMIDEEIESCEECWDRYGKEIQKGMVETHTDENGQTYTKSNSGLWFDGDGNWVKLDDVSGLFID